MRYEFEWDPDKAKINSRKHGVNFEESATIFKDSSILSIFDEDHSKNEERWISIGLSSNGKLLVVIHTFKAESESETKIRIISARRATRKEAKNYKRV
jgi:uncharacterized DUF497 family protein